MEDDRGPPVEPPFVVLVEEHPELRQVLLHALGEEGYEARAVPDERAAVELAGERTLDLLIADVDTSAEALPLVWEKLPELHTIVLSDDAGPAGVFFGPWGVDGVRRTLRKPFKLSDLLAAAREALEDREPDEESVAESHSD